MGADPLDVRARALEVRLAEVERERDEWKATAETWEDGTGAQLLVAERDEAVRERDHARDALRRIADWRGFRHTGEVRDFAAKAAGPRP